MARCGRRPGVHRCRRPQLPACTCNPLTAALHSTRCCRVLRGRRAPSLASRPRSRAYLRRPFSPFSTMRRSSRAHCGCSELCARPGRRKAAWSCEAVAVASVVAHCLWLKNEMYFNRTTYARTDRGGSRGRAPNKCSTFLCILANSTARAARKIFEPGRAGREAPSQARRRRRKF